MENSGPLFQFRIQNSSLRWLFSYKAESKTMMNFSDIDMLSCRERYKAGRVIIILNSEL